MSGSFDKRSMRAAASRRVAWRREGGRTQVLAAAVKIVLRLFGGLAGLEGLHSLLFLGENARRFTAGLGPLESGRAPSSAR